MRQLAKILMLFMLSNGILSACALCNMTTPTVYVETNTTTVDQNITVNVKWTFTEPFTIQTMNSYPAKFDIRFKLQEIKKSLENYLDENNYLAVITYDTNKTYKIDKLLDSSLSIVSDVFVYKFSFNTDITEEQKKNLFIDFIDMNHYFTFVFSQPGIIDEPQEPQSEFIKSLSKLLQDLTQGIKELLDEVEKSTSAMAYIWLFLFSFGYGVIHAAGPGHGKSLISSYFISEKSSHLKALSMASTIGVVHTFSAFILTFVIYYSVNSFLGSYFNDVETVATKMSAIIIIAIALFLIYKKISKHKHQHSCGCSGCKTHSTDIGVILGAGLVPCAGTVTIFIYTMSLNLYFIGFLSAIFMSFGMSLVIYITALLSIKIRDKASSNIKLIKFFEYASLAFILSLGIILLIV